MRPHILEAIVRILMNQSVYYLGSRQDALVAYKGLVVGIPKSKNTSCHGGDS